MDDIWVVYLFLAAFPALIVVAALYKYMEVMQASRWPSVPGRVVVSTAESRAVSAGEADTDDTERRNFAKVVYEYKVATRTYRCNRVSIGEDIGNSDDIAATLAKYPVGAAVTVYYNPNKRNQAVLERDAPPGIWKGVALLVFGMVAVIVGGIYGFTALGTALMALVPNKEHAPFAAASACFALVTALVILGLQRAGNRARAWPIASGRIESSGTHAFQARDSGNKGGSTRWRTMYRPDVIYGYEVAGVRYTGDKVPVAGKFSSSLEAVARRSAAKYPVGTVVSVHYNPVNPAESILEPRVPGIRLLWVMPVLLLALAYYTGYVAP